MSATKITITKLSLGVEFHILLGKNKLNFMKPASFRDSRKICDNFLGAFEWQISTSLTWNNYSNGNLQEKIQQVLDLAKNYQEEIL